MSIINDKTHLTQEQEITTTKTNNCFKVNTEVLALGKATDLIQGFGTISSDYDNWMGWDQFEL